MTFSVERGRIFDDVANERERQDAKWGPQSNHSVELWMTILGEEFGECCEAALDSRKIGSVGVEGMRHLREELIQLMAVACHMVEIIDRKI